jgi:hypothetical protein
MRRRYRDFADILCRERGGLQGLVNAGAAEPVLRQWRAQDVAQKAGSGLVIEGTCVGLGVAAPLART